MFKTGFYSILCIQLCQAYENLALNKKTWQLTSCCLNNPTWSYAANAVDGKVNQYILNETCAISADKQQTAEWRVDLGGILSIHRVKIFFRTENIWETTFKERNIGFYLYVSNTTSKEDGFLCFHNPAKVEPITRTKCIRHGKYVILYNKIDHSINSTTPYLDLCEVKVLGCPENGYYGNDCNITCPQNCQENRCYINNGTCLGCIDGYKGQKCEQECSEGHYGLECRERCSGNCHTGSKCDHISGSCTRGCKPGWKGDKCNEKCAKGAFGLNCSNECSVNCKSRMECDHETGSCSGGCSAGWKGSLCNKECDGHMYGENCGDHCGECRNNMQCHHVNGTCFSGCIEGFQGERCNKVCDRSTFGQNCSYQCGHCRNNTQCNHVDGTCLSGCDIGYQGNRCRKGSSFRYDTKVDIAVVIGTTIGGFVTLVIIILIISCHCVRKRKMEQKMYETPSIAVDRHIYSTTDHEEANDYMEIDA